MTLYLKYRPQTIKDLDLKSVRESLSKIVKSGDIPHAFLFYGPRGTGKTSAARILAKVLNCENPGKDGEPCNKCGSCKSITKGENLDVIEMDAASHRGIDDIRILRDAVKLAPLSSKVKVYIIDEAHMLTTEASNALLKTLEEPPEHVTFILATTNPEKLIDTIRSRTTAIKFTEASLEEIVGRLEKVAKSEKIKADKKVLETIAEAAQGSFRDAVKLMEQLKSEGASFKDGDLENTILKKTSINITEFLKLLDDKKSKKALEKVESMVSQGVSMRYFCEELVKSLRQELLYRVGLQKENIGFHKENKSKLGKYQLIQLIKLFSQAGNEVKFSLLEQLPVELAVIEWCEEDDDIHRETTEVKVKKKAEKKKSKAKKKSSNAAGSKLEKKLENGNKKNTNFSDEKDKEGDNGVNAFTSNWGNILKLLRQKNTSTEALLRAAKPLDFDGNILKLGVYYSFHKERLEENQHRRLLENIVSGIYGSRVRISCQLTKPPKKIIPEAHNGIQENTSIEGGDELNTDPLRHSFSEASIPQPLGKPHLPGGGGRHENQIKEEANHNETVGPNGDAVLTEADDDDIVRLAKEVFGE